MEEDIRWLVQEEGRTARNLIAFSVPVVQMQYDSGRVMKKPPTSPRLHLDCRKDDLTRSSKRSCEASQSGSRVRSASTGRDKKSELHARYWAFLFGNLQRAVDEIYQTCESDESVTECKEVMMVLDNYTRDFHNLIDWFKIKWEYEHTPPPQRPTSLAWEIRKSSPGKIRHVKNSEPVLIEAVKRQLPFGEGDKSNDVSSDENDAPSEVKVEMEIQTSNEPLHANNCSDTGSNSESINSNVETVVPDDPKVESLTVETNELSTVLDCAKTEEMKNSPMTNTVMIDEICQTDREEDVDENGPKYRCSSQQTCPILSGLKSEEEPKKSPTEMPMKADIGKSVESSRGASKPENVKTLPKPVASTPGTPKMSSSTSQASTPTSSKGPVRNSYSFATTSHTKTPPTAQVAKISTPVKVARSAVTGTASRPAYSAVSRQPWGARPLSSIPGRQVAFPTNTGYSSVTRLTRSRTLAEVRGSNRETPVSATSGNAKPSRTVLAPKQSRLQVSSTIGVSRSAQVVQAKPSGITRNKILPLPVKKLKDPKDEGKPKSLESNVKEASAPERNSISNSNTSLNSSTSSTVKHLDDSGSVETLTPDGHKNEDDDGWVKVRSRSRFSPATKTDGLETSLSRSASNLKPRMEQKTNIKMQAKTRFHQPSSAISLPTLAFSLGDTKENVISKKSEVKSNKTKADSKNKAKENQKPTKKTEKSKGDETNAKTKNNVEKLNKRNSNKFLNEKNSNKDKESSAMVEKMENDKNTIMNEKIVSKSILIDAEAIDDEENHFDEEIKKNKETEEMLQKEIHELEATDIEVDVETGDEETDGETTTGTEDEPDPKVTNFVVEHMEKQPSPKKQHHFEQILNGMSWADHMDTLDELEKLVAQDCTNKGMTRDEQMDTLERLEELVARHPGRALELHQKLSSPSRRRTIPDTVKRFQARQAKALAKREQLKMEKATKLRELLKKVDEVKAAKDKLIEERRQRLEMKLKRAAENRNLHLKEIMRKAHDEEEKLKEIAFINELEAQNKRHDFMTQCQEQEDRLQGIHEERQRKQEEKAAKEAAVEERRKAIEAERQEKLEKMQERQRKRDEQADKKKQEKEKERQELAREKARDRSERLEALHAAQLEAQEELQKKIQQKQEESARRHEENIEQIRQKALELSILKCSDDVAPRLAPYDTQKLCTACNVLISSEVHLLSHLRGRKHQEAVRNQHGGKELTKEEVESFNIKIIVNAPADKIDPKIALDKERVKSLKKKCKKIRLRMNSKGVDHLAKLTCDERIDSPNKGKLHKSLKDIEKVISSQGKGQWSDSAVTTLERAMGEIGRTLNKQDAQDQLAFKALNGFSTLCSILQLDMDVPAHMAAYLPQKCFVTTCTSFLSAVINSVSNSKFVLLSNKIATLLDLLLKRLTVLIPDHGRVPSNCGAATSLPVDPVASTVMRVIAKILVCLQEVESSDPDDYMQRLQDVVSYTVSVGIVDKLTRYCEGVRDPIDDDPSAAQFLLSALDLLTTLTARCKTVRRGNDDPTQLLATLQVTELVGAVSILYGMLLHQDAPPRQMDAVPPALPSHTVAVALATIRLLRTVAELDLQMFQSILGAEGISLQFRHIASYLLWYCCHDKEKDLLHEVVAVVGFFAVQHRDNQMILQSGYMPTVLQQLCNLPFPYFSNPELSALLFPTLLACCCGNDENKAILEQEISYSLLEDFLTSEAARNHPLIPLLPVK